jgi:putative tryptophan/tyrosine transport system substrate-binding protein
MRRRDFIKLLGGAAAGWPLAARAQRGERVRRLGVLTGFAEDDPTGQKVVAAFRQRLAELGWAEGRNVRIEVRWAAAGDTDLMQAGAIDLAEFAPELILVHGNRALSAVQKEMRGVPILFAGISDPVSSGFVANLAHPGGNITGFTVFEGSNVGKLASLLKEVAPGITRVALILSADFDVTGNYSLDAFKAAVAALDLSAVIIPIRDPAAIEPAIEMFAREPNGALLASTDQTIVTYRAPIIAAAARYRVPAIYARRELVADGGLMSYGVDLAANYRMAAGYADRILRGEKPGDLPVQQPTRFELVINLKTAQSLGLTVPPTLLAIADEVIE